MSNFSARLTEEEHRRMRTAAALADISMKEIIIRGLEKVEAELKEKIEDKSVSRKDSQVA